MLEKGSEQFVVLDVGSVEYSDHTEVIGIYPDYEAAVEAFNAAADKIGIEEWKPRSSRGENSSTFLGGCDYFAIGPRSLELHVIPAAGEGR